MNRERARPRTILLCAGTLLLGLGAAARGAAQDPKPSHPSASPATDEAALIAETRRDADHTRRRGDPEKAARDLAELIDADAKDAESRLLLARCRWDLGQAGAALEAARMALAASKEPPANKPLRAGAARDLAGWLITLGQTAEALALLEAESSALAPADDARDAWALGSARWSAGQRKSARETLTLGAHTGAGQGWEGLWARGLCQRRLGDLEGGSESFVLADDKAKADEGVEPDVLAALGALYFEADKEVADGAKRSAARLYKEALALHPLHEGATLGLYQLHHTNWQRQSRSSQSILEEFLSARPDSIDALVLATSADIDDGNLKSARERLVKLDLAAGLRRDVRALHAVLAWIEQRESACNKQMAELAAEDPVDSTPERELARHLNELYRFAEALPFAKRATERDAHDWEAWTQLGRALANTGDEPTAREALDRAQSEAGSRQDAWRNNLRLVLKKIAGEMPREKGGELVFAWNPAAAEVLRTYLVPFYEESRKELAQRYGYTPGLTAIEVFQKHADFSVRSTGFEGYPALGVCFGPVVTAVSPLAELRGSFSWERTSFHEFTHVIHLGLSHNRCPRWITEGIATWEEVNKNPSWTRNMRRELVDARANGELIGVRDLNRAFRGPRILFGYYQGGLLVQSWIEERGFPPIVRLLEAFDRGLDIDQAFKEVFACTPEDVDRKFATFVEREIKDLYIEPRWGSTRVASLGLSLARTAPKDPAKLTRWAEDWATLAWGDWQAGRKLDAEEALRALGTGAAQAGLSEPVRAQFLRAEMAFKADDDEHAATLYEQAFAAGGEDFRARIAYAALCEKRGLNDKALAAYLAAEKAFPGYDEKELCAELKLAALYKRMGQPDLAMAAAERWLAWDAGDFNGRRAVAAWHLDHGRNAPALHCLEEANAIDPFRRKLHEDWGDALRGAQRFEEALREYQVGPKVPANLDLDQPGLLEKPEEARWLGKQARCLAALGRKEEAAAVAKHALELDPDAEDAREVLEKGS